MKTVISLFFQIYDGLVIVACAIALVRAIPREWETARWRRLLAWIIYMALAYLLPMFRNDILTTILLTLYYVGVGRLLYYKNKMGILYQIIYGMVFVTSQYMAAYLTAYIGNGLQLDRTIILPLLIVIRSALLVFVTLILRRLMQKRYVADGSGMKIRGMIIIPIFSLILIFMYVIASDVFVFRYGYGWLLVYCVLFLVMNFYCLYFWYDVAKNRELKHRLSLMQQQSELTLQYYRDLEENYSRSRKIIHDIRNHLAVIEQASKMEDDSYIADVHGMLNSLGMKFYTENRMLNIVLNDKLREFLPEHLECRLGGVNLDFISDLDITTIFANLLDNALEAQPKKETRTIKIKGEHIQEFTIIKISNPWEGNYIAGRSTKAGHEGLGLQNVQTAVEKYHGEIRIENGDLKFSVTIAFQNEGGSKK